MKEEDRKSGESERIYFTIHRKDKGIRFLKKLG